MNHKDFTKDNWSKGMFCFQFKIEESDDMEWRKELLLKFLRKYGSWDFCEVEENVVKRLNEELPLSEYSGRREKYFHFWMTDSFFNMTDNFEARPKIPSISFDYIYQTEEDAFLEKYSHLV